MSPQWLELIDHSDEFEQTHAWLFASKQISTPEDQLRLDQLGSYETETIADTLFLSWDGPDVLQAHWRPLSLQVLVPRSDVTALRPLWETVEVKEFNSSTSAVSLSTSTVWSIACGLAIAASAGEKRGCSY